MSNKVIVLDLETTVQDLEGTKDNSPFNPKNKIVSIHWTTLDGEQINPVQTIVVHHNERPVNQPMRSELNEQLSYFRNILKDADVVVAHNAKFDILYLLEAGFDLPERCYCTMVGEYIFARSQRVELSLAKTAERRDVTRKKSDLVDELFKGGTGFEAMPLDIVIEYAEADVQSCAEIYLAQQADLKKASNQTLRPVFDLMNEMLLFLAEIERNGIFIDLNALAEVEAEFVAEKEQIQRTLDKIVSDIMGDTPINLNSGIDMTKVVYSRYILDRDYHKRTFNIGVDHRGKPLRPPRMSKAQFENTVRKSTRKVYRTIAHHCKTCSGSGKIQKYKKDGEPWKNLTKCPDCDGVGFNLENTPQVAGLKLIPEGPQDTSINGFKTDKITIKKLISQAQSKEKYVAVEFLTGLSRLNAINTYLDSFVKNFKLWTRSDGRLHAQFNQCVTKTGRLSSSNPNFQNIPKGGKFPVRRCVVSRFHGGEIMEADFSGLEFRVAGELSKDPQIIDDIESGKDVHKQTAAIINQCSVDDVTKDMRQAAKAYTFAPLYGGMGANEPPHVQKYFKEYFKIYTGLAKWHKTLMDGAVEHNLVRTPSGREFHFPNTRRLGNGRVTNATNIVNYPVQSFATADVVVLSCVRAHQAFKEAHLRSRLILTVHDSIVVDVHPSEKNMVVDLLTWAMQSVSDDIEKRFNYKMLMPLDIEIEVGKNWMEQTEYIID